MKELNIHEKLYTYGIPGYQNGFLLVRLMGTLISFEMFHLNIGESGLVG